MHTLRSDTLHIPGTKYEGVRYRTALLHTIREIGTSHHCLSLGVRIEDRYSHVDKVAHLVMPRHPTLRPHARMLHHFRFLLPLLPRDPDGLSPLHYYDSVIQLVRHASREPSEAEFALGMDAAREIKRMYVIHRSTARLRLR